MLKAVRRFAAVWILAFTVAIRLPVLLHPWPINDEWPYSIVANEMIDGGRLYLDVVDRKPPLLFWTYAAIFKVVGKYNWWGLHAASLIWTLATMVGLYVIGRTLFDRQTGLIAAFLYSLFQPWATNQNLAFNGEIMMNLPIVWAWAIAFRRSSSPVRPELLGSGALLCAAFLLKQPGAIAAVPLGLYLLLPGYRRSRKLTPGASVLQAVVLAAGFFGTLLLVILILYQQGLLHEAFYWTITDHADPYIFWRSGFVITSYFLGACLPLLIAATMAVWDRSGLWLKNQPERTALIGLVVASAFGAAAGGRFYPHYYIQLIPPLALLAAPVFARLWSGEGKLKYGRFTPALATTWFIIIVIAFSLSYWIFLIPKRGISQTGRYLSEQSVPEDRIFVWGNDSKFYLEARRRPASRFFMNYPLTGYLFPGELHEKVGQRRPVPPGAWAALEQDFQRHPPRYIVAPRPNQRTISYPINDFPFLSRLLAERYHPVADTADATIYQAW